MATYTLWLDAHDAQFISAVRAAVEDLLLRDVNLNGATVDVLRGEFTSVGGPDMYAGSRLLNLVRELREADNSDDFEEEADEDDS